MNFLMVLMVLAIWFLMNHHGYLTQPPLERVHAVRRVIARMSEMSHSPPERAPGRLLQRCMGAAGRAGR
jgi:hypothetical protein